MGDVYKLNNRTLKHGTQSNKTTPLKHRELNRPLEYMVQIDLTNMPINYAVMSRQGDLCKI